MPDELIPSERTPAALLALCRATVCATDWDERPQTPAEWRSLTEAADRHGLVPLLHAQRLDDGPKSVPADLARSWRELYRGQLVRSACGLRQLRQISAACAEHGLEILILKGGAALLWLYQDPGMRMVGDLDVLTREQDAPRLAALLEALGYGSTAPRAPARSEEEAILAQRRRLHLPQMHRGSQLPIEVHLRLFRRSDRTPILPEVWSEAICPDPSQPALKILSPSHFLLHGCIHYWKHWQEGFSPLKGLLDLLLVVRVYGESLDWRRLWRTSREWGIEAEAACVLGSMSQAWDLQIPGLPPGAPVLSARDLVIGRLPAPPPGSWSTGLTYLERARQLPGLPARARYLFRAAFPEPAYLRRRFGSPEGGPLLGHYLRYACSGVVRVAIGLPRVVLLRRAVAGTRRAVRGRDR